jgi:hypothetical protein
VTGTEPHGVPSHDPDLSKMLTSLGYLELFLRADDAAVGEVWRQPGAPERLRLLVADPDAPPLARFLAAEVLAARDPTFPSPDDRMPMGRLYAEALRRNLAGMANPWGLPGELDGPLARHVLALGGAAVPALAQLLDDDDGLRYGGSKEATVGNSYGYRVKDVAASLIAALLGVPHRVQLAPGARDVDIDLLARHITDE